MTASELKAAIAAAGKEGYFFTRKTMQFFGDTMRNYGVRGPMKFVTHGGIERQVWELYRRKAVKHGLKTSAYFDAETFEQRFGEVQS